MTLGLKCLFSTSNILFSSSILGSSSSSGGDSWSAELNAAYDSKQSLYGNLLAQKPNLDDITLLDDHIPVVDSGV